MVELNAPKANRRRPLLPVPASNVPRGRGSRRRRELASVLEKLAAGDATPFGSASRPARRCTDSKKRVAEGKSGVVRGRGQLKLQNEREP
jgi:hypothetical protein